MSLNDFEIIKRLGEGAYSSVYHVRRIADNDFYALKKVRMLKLSDKEKENALNEVRILASIRHPNIVAYREAFIDDASQSLCIIMEYADSGDLFQQICDHQKNNTLFKEDEIWKMFIQMVRGLRCLHEIMIFHRDLKSANIFLNKDGTAKLGDMNVSKVARKGMLYTQTGTPYYASPEVWRDQPYDNKSDIWSLGCVLYESITLKPPFRADDMQGLYKKVLRGVYPKIPGVYSTDLANLVKSLVQVTPQMRPSCERILDMPFVRKKIEKIFPNDEFYDSQSSLLNTIRVPKNLLYLTDRLPKPSYDSPTYKKRMDEEERLRRKTHDAGGMLPDIKNQRKSKNAPNVDHQSAAPQLSSQATGTRKKQNQKSVRVKSDMRGGEGSQMQDGYQGAGEDSTAKVGTASQEEDRRSVVSKGSVSQSQNPQVQHKDSNGALRKNSTKRSQQAVVSISHRVREQQQPRDRKGDIHEEYDDDQFERDEQNHHSPAPGRGSRHHQDDRESYQDTQLSPQQQQQISPQTKRSNISKGPVSLPPQMSNPQMMLLSNRPQLNHGGLQAAAAGPQSMDRNYLQKAPHPLPSLADGSNQQSRKNLAYINISGEGAKPVGYLGLKKAEKDLIMRRYKYNHMNQNDHIQRVALIYGNGTGPGGQGGSNNAPQYQYSYGQNNQVNSPYMQNQLPPSIVGPQSNNQISGIIKRNKYAPQNIIEENTTVGSGGVGGSAAIRLPKLPSVGRQNLDHNGGNQQSQAMLPPLGVVGGVPSVNGQSILTKQQQQAYHPYIVKPTKLKSIPKPLLGPSQGISGEKINLNKYGGGSLPTGIVDRSLNGSHNHDNHHPQTMVVPAIINGQSRANQLLSIGSTHGSQQPPSQPQVDPSRDVRKVYKKRAKPSASVGAAGQPLTRNIITSSGNNENHAGELSAAGGDGYE